MKPKHKHDCEECEYRGSLQLGDKWFDFYRCPQGGIKTTLARYGSDGPEYFSFPDAAFVSVSRDLVMDICGAICQSNGPLWKMSMSFVTKKETD